jgi:hypothetical protein
VHIQYILDPLSPYEQLLDQFKLQISTTCAEINCMTITSIISRSTHANCRLYSSPLSLEREYIPVDGTYDVFTETSRVTGALRALAGVRSQPVVVRVIVIVVVIGGL